MAWTVVLEDEEKGELAVVSKDIDIPVEALSGLRMLRYLDSYGDATFNKLQIDELIVDLVSLESILSRPILDEIKKLAERCQNEPHTYLVFYGE